MDLISNKIISIILLGLLLYFIYRINQRKKMKFFVLAKKLGAKPIDSGVIGKYQGQEYIIYFQDGMPGGGAGGAGSAAFPASVRLCFELNSDLDFRFFHDQEINSPENILNPELVKQSVEQLFGLGYKEILCDGELLDIKYYPASMDGQFNADFFKKSFTMSGDLIKAIQT